jgi:hypothetical protein
MHLLWMIIKGAALLFAVMVAVGTGGTYGRPRIVEDKTTETRQSMWLVFLVGVAAVVTWLLWLTNGWIAAGVWMAGGYLIGYITERLLWTGKTPEECRSWLDAAVQRREAAQKQADKQAEEEVEKELEAAAQRRDAVRQQAKERAEKALPDTLQKDLEFLRGKHVTAAQFAFANQMLEESFVKGLSSKKIEDQVDAIDAAPTLDEAWLKTAAARSAAQPLAACLTRLRKHLPRETLEKAGWVLKAIDPLRGAAFFVLLSSEESLGEVERTSPGDTTQYCQEAKDLDVDRPHCFSCGKPLEAGGALFGGQGVMTFGVGSRPLDEVQQDHRLFNGTVCFKCLAVFCLDCVGQPIDKCPKCQGPTEPGLRRQLLELRGQAAAKWVTAFKEKHAGAGSSVSVPSTEATDSMVEVYANEILRFLHSSRTKGYEQQTDAWWTKEHLEVILAEAGFMEDAGEAFAPCAEKAIQSLVARGLLRTNGQGYRSA